MFIITKQILTYLLQEVCSAMLSLYLLDSLPVTDALDTFLKHRSRSLQGLLNESVGGIPTSAKSADKSSKASFRQDKRTSRETLETIRNVLSAVARTVGTAREILHVGDSDCPSLLVKVLAYLQVETPPNASPSIPDELQLTTQSLLASLPSSSHFSYLPESITSYKPFIDLESPSSRVEQNILASKLRSWMDGTIVHLETSMRIWFSKLEAVRAVWDVRNSVQRWLDEDKCLAGDEMIRIRNLLDSVCQMRVEGIWNTTLNTMESTLKTNLSSLLNSVKEEHVDIEQGKTAGHDMLLD